MKFESDKAPKPIGAYPHARKIGKLLFLSGVGPRKQNSNEIPGVELDKDGNVISHDIVGPKAILCLIISGLYLKNQAATGII
ncbi:MAG: hypothetical protein Ct9H300mP29_7580 [Candidatus Neomarinimicrobiota bacterium]|nr:MAG: hypothetical protein Ct9H300mP29_7580 [Candidatus Neomarinimicrobiota bacterium]